MGFASDIYFRGIEWPRHQAQRSECSLLRVVLLLAEVQRVEPNVPLSDSEFPSAVSTDVAFQSPSALTSKGLSFRDRPCMTGKSQCDQ